MSPAISCQSVNAFISCNSLCGVNLCALCHFGTVKKRVVSFFWFKFAYMLFFLYSFSIYFSLAQVELSAWNGFLIRTRKISMTEEFFLKKPLHCQRLIHIIKYKHWKYVQLSLRSLFRQIYWKTDWYTKHWGGIDFFLKQIYVAKQNSTSSSSKLTKWVQNNVCVSPSESYIHEISELVWWSIESWHWVHQESYVQHLWK